MLPRDRIAEIALKEVDFLRSLALGEPVAIARVRATDGVGTIDGLWSFVRKLTAFRRHKTITLLEDISCRAYYGTVAGSEVVASPDFAEPLAELIASALHRLDVGTLTSDENAVERLRSKLMVFAQIADQATLEQNRGAYRRKLEEREQILRRDLEFKRFLRERTQHRRLFELLDSFLASRKVPQARVGTPVVRDEDAILALSWNPVLKPVRDALQEGAITLDGLAHRYEKDYEIGRLLSARLAERVAMEYYRALGRDVRDVAITQLQGGRDWATHDLMADGVPLDVKNARRSRYRRSGQHRDHYVEHCVPAFKTTRNRSNVVVVGVMSPYMWARSMIQPRTTTGGWDDHVYVLGECHADKLRSLRRTFHQPGRFELGIGGRGASALPPWVFDHPVPDSTGPARGFDTGVLGAALDQVQDDLPDGVNPVALGLAIGRDAEDVLERWPLPAWKQALVRRLWDERQAGAYSLPFVFLRVLTHFLEMVRDPADGFDPAGYGEILFPRRNSRRPLALPDTLHTVDSLVRCLSTLWSGDHSLLQRYACFKLVGMRILRGWNEEALRWETLLSHCGGRKTGDGLCGYYPLLLDTQERQCPLCGYLICPVCGDCLSPCCSTTDEDPSAHNPDAAP